MTHYDYLTQGTCSKVISLDLEGDVVHNIQFLGGCDGNLKAIPLLVEGWTVEEIASRLEGVQCGRRGTSCADQLSKAVREAYAAAREQA